MGEDAPTRLVVETAVAGLELRRLRPDDALAYHELMQRNVEHLSTLPGATERPPDAWARQFANPDERVLEMGVYLADVLIGHVGMTPLSMSAGDDLPDDPNAFTIGYWIAADYSGRGYITEACRALIDHARATLGASGFWSAAARTNPASIRVLEKLGFTVEREQGEGVRFHLDG